MKKNIDMLMGLNSSQKVLLALTKKGLSREKSYKIVQKSAKESWMGKSSFINSLLKFDDCKSRLTKKEIESIINDTSYMKHLNKIFKRIFKK